MTDANEENYLMLSGIQHFQFCKRQWALIHIEQQWEENVRTIEGQEIHKKVDQPFTREKRNDKLVVRGMPIKSDELGMSGICDAVEFIKDKNGVEIHGMEGKYSAYPVEYKRGKPKSGDEDVLQLAAQAISLEEMLLCEVKTGFLFYNEIKRRVEIPMTQELKAKVKETAKEMFDFYQRRHTPKVKTGNFCKSCSLQNICLPKLMRKSSAKDYIESRLSE